MYMYAYANTLGWVLKEKEKNHLKFPGCQPINPYYYVRYNIYKYTCRTGEK